MTRFLLLVTGVAALAIASPAAAQGMDHDGHDMSGMDHTVSRPMPPPTDHAGHDMAGMEHETAAASAPPVGDAPAPPVPTDHAADRFWDPARMAQSRMNDLHGHFRTGAMMIEQLEYRAIDGRDGYGWEAEAWYGGDIDRVMLTTEGEGAFGAKPERFETALLWRHALDSWFNLQIGARHDVYSGPDRTYAVAGIEGLAPYWIEAEAQLFVSTKGEVHARVEARHDARITQRLILQPAIEADFAAQDVPEIGVGSGLDRLELGLRLRYQLAREFAPYVGVHWERRFGDSARFAHASGDRAETASAVIGINAWF